MFYTTDTKVFTTSPTVVLERKNVSFTAVQGGILFVEQNQMAVRTYNEEVLDTNANRLRQNSVRERYVQWWESHSFLRLIDVEEQTGVFR